MNFNDENQIYYQHWFIVIAFLVCWPVGIVLLIMKTRVSKRAAFDASFVSKACYIIGGLMALIGISSLRHFSGWFYLAGGIGLIYYANKNKKKVERYKVYIDLVANQKIYSIDTIANTLNIPYDEAKKDIQSLIDRGSFRGASINELSRMVEIQAITQNAPQQSFWGGVNEAINGAASSNANAQTVTAICPGCGGTMVATKGATVECDYCGKMFTA